MSEQPDEKPVLADMTSSATNGENDSKVDEELLATDSEEDDDMYLTSEESGEDGEQMDDDDDDDEDDEDEGMGDEGMEEEGAVGGGTYIPNEDNAVDPEELEMDESAYVMYHKAECGYPCLSFDIVTDGLGEGEERASNFPLTVHLVAGTQAPKVHANKLLVMQMSNLVKMKPRKPGDEQNGEESDDEDDADMPKLACAQIPHNGSVNRVRTAKLGSKQVAATWSELGQVYLWDLTQQLQAVGNPETMKVYLKRKDAPKPLFSFSGHQCEGYGMDWSQVAPGWLATGDCKNSIHVWSPREGGSWHVNQQPLNGHAGSVEDLQWSPTEANVLASSSVDKSIRVWDTRAKPSKCMITVPDAHDSDINVIAWNRKEHAFLLSGGDDGALKTWDLRHFGRAQKPEAIATFKHHLGPITSVEWHPTDSTVFGASSEDNQITLWDLAVEKDDDEDGADGQDAQLNKLPPQLLFIHQGQNEIKEIHWHSQIPGLVTSTSATGFDVFKTISV